MSRSSRRPGWVGCHAGLTERTSFRHYADKREVLFAGSVDVQERFVLAVAGALKSAAPIEALAVGLDAVSDLFADHRDFARSRQAVMRESLDELKAVTAGRQ